MQFLVLWLGYPLADATWEPVDGLLNAKVAVRDYVRQKNLPMPPGFEDETSSAPGAVVTVQG